MGLMMSEYTPDNWVVLKINHEGETLYKVLGGWSGGYLDDLDGYGWRMNSGITRVEQPGDGWNLFYDTSCSCYECHEKHYGLRWTNAGVYNKLKEQLGDAVEMMPEDTDWFNVE